MPSLELAACGILRLKLKLLSSRGVFSRAVRLIERGPMLLRAKIIRIVVATSLCTQVLAAATQKSYFAHQAVEDRNGVIAPWYKEQNGQFDFRVRVAAETLKRYPWVGKDRAVSPAPAYVYSGTWHIDSNGTIKVLPEKDWANGDVGQRAAQILSGMIDYYRYSGDPAAFAAISATADYLVDHCQTDSHHGWPHMLISVPNMGARYGDCRLGTSDNLKTGNGKIQLDTVAEVGLQLVRAYEMTGNRRWYDAARHWADLLAANRRHGPDAPWGRYANNSDGKGMNGIQTGGVASILELFDELIGTGYYGPNNSMIAARDAGIKYLRDVLLPAWTVDDTWGRNYWDWEDAVQSEDPTGPVLAYMMDHKDSFPNWKNDTRNIFGLFLNHTSASPDSRGDVYSGAWSYPESSSCCSRSLSYPSVSVGGVFARYSVEAGSEWAREIARRSELLATYDALPNGQAMDDIDGGSPVDGIWFKIAHPMPLEYVLDAMGWLPDMMGANRENHIMRTSSVVKQVSYGKGEIRYRTFDGAVTATDVLRLAFAPASVSANDRQLRRRSDLAANGYTVRELPGGDCIVTIRHRGATYIVVRGADPQSAAEAREMTFSGTWQTVRMSGKIPEEREASQEGASATYRFIGNQVRLLGAVGKFGGRAQVYIDDALQLVPIDSYSSVPLSSQVIYYKNGLSDVSHTLKIVLEGKHNPLSAGNQIVLDGVEYSDAGGNSGFGEGGGPVGEQRMVFGYTGRKDYIDTKGNAWRPGTEFIARVGTHADTVARTWWTMRQALTVAKTPDPELYLYGIHWPDFTVNATVGPGAYHVRLKFAETQYSAVNQRGITIYINGEKVADRVDIIASAGGPNRATDLIYNGIRPKNGIIAIRFTGAKIGGCQRDAMVQAIEVGPGDEGGGDNPKSLTVAAQE